VLLEELAAEPAERQRLLRSYFEPNDEDREQGRKTPTAAHTAIARLVRDGAVKERKSAARKARRKAAAPKCLTLADVLGRSTPLRGVGLRLDRPARDDQEAPIGATAKQVWPCRESARPSEAVPPATTGAGNVGSTSAAAARASA